MGISCQKDKLEEKNSVVIFSSDKNKYSCDESIGAQLRKKFGDIPLPILLLTYKNHALDEFLLRMVELLGMDNVLRIGGRSKEPKLDECNLEFRKNTFSANAEKKTYFLKDLFDVKRDVKREINELQDQVDKIMDLQQSSIFNVISLLRLLDDRQVKNLLQKSNVKKAEQRWLQFVFNRLYDEGNYVGDFLLYLYQEIDLEAEVTCHPTYKNFSLKKIWEKA